MEVHTEEFIYQVSVFNEDIARIEEALDAETDATEEISRWCEESCGEIYVTWYNKYEDSYGAETYCFKNEKDRNWFLIRWG